MERHGANEEIQLSEKTVVSVPISVLISMAVAIIGGAAWCTNLWFQVNALSAKVESLDNAKIQTGQDIVAIRSDVSYIKISIDDIKKSLEGRKLPL